MVDGIPLSILFDHGVMTCPLFKFIGLQNRVIGVIIWILFKFDFRQIRFVCFCSGIADVVGGLFKAVARIHDILPLPFPKIESTFNCMPVLTLLVPVFPVDVLVHCWLHNQNRITGRCKGIQHLVHIDTSAYSLTFKAVGGIKQKKACFVLNDMGIDGKGFQNPLHHSEGTKGTVRDGNVHRAIVVALIRNHIGTFHRVIHIEFPIKLDYTGRPECAQTGRRHNSTIVLPAL